MKQILNLVTVIAVIGLAAFSGCTKISFNLNPTPNSVVPGFMKASINGAPFADTSSLVFNISGTQMLIAGTDTATNVFVQITLLINSYKGAGTYIIPGTGIPVNSCWIDSTEAPIYAVYGTVIITATTPNIVGTFSFTCADSTKVTNGSFSAQTP
jgi:hypothetical protein